MSKTIYDVAKEAGVSVSTVSRAINNSGYVSAKTKKRIMDALDGFQPNAAAQRLVTKISKTVAVVSVLPAKYFFMESDYGRVLAGIQNCANEYGYRILLDIDGRNNECITLYRKNLIDAILLINSSYEDDAKLLDRILDSQVPVALLGQYPKESERLTWVDVDRRTAAFDTVSYLISLGHKNIAMINSPMNRDLSVIKFNGYKEALEAANLTFDPNNLVICDDVDASHRWYEAGRELLLRNPRPTAIYTYSDMAALEVYRAAWDLGLRIPEDLSVAGFGNSEVSRTCSPLLTTASQPIYDKGYAVAKLLFEQLSNINRDEPCPPVGKMFPCELIIRDSCSAPRL